MKNKQEFLKKLQDLLQEYNAVIFLDYADCSDTHGMHDMHFKIDIQGEKFRLLDDCCLSAYEIKLILEHGEEENGKI